MNLTKLSRNDLLLKCQENGIKKYKSKTKAELIALLQNTNVPENGAEQVSENGAEQLPENEAEQVPENGAEQVSENGAEQVSENGAEQVSENEAEQLPENEAEQEDVTTDHFINDKISLYFGDCIVEMSKIENDSIELILCDLPYGTTKCKWDTIIDLNELWKQYKRIIKKPSGVILLFGQQPFTSMLVSSNYDWFKYNLIWKKNKTTQFLLANYRPMKCTEDICVFSKGGAAAASKTTGNMTYNPQGLIPTNIKKKK